MRRVAPCLVVVAAVTAVASVPAWAVEPVRYDLDPIVVDASREGPRAIWAPLPYSQRELAAAITGSALAGCYRWARWRRPDLRGDVALVVRVDPAGTIASVRTTSAPADADELMACVRDVLAGADLGRVVPRVSEHPVRLRFEPSGQRRPARLPQRPRAHPGPAGCAPARECGPSRASLVTDTVTSAAIVAVDDWDPAQAERDEKAKIADGYRQARAEWRREGRHGPPPRQVDVIGCGARTRGSYDKLYVQEAVASNLGAYRACRARPDLQGEVVFEAPLDATTGRIGAPRLLRSTAALEDVTTCLGRALADVRVYPAIDGQRVLLNVGFRLVGPARSAGTQLQIPSVVANRACGAERLVPAAPEPPRLRPGTTPGACSALADRVRAAAQRAPARDDPAVDVALAELVAWTSAHAADPQTKECLAAATPALMESASRPEALGWHLKQQALSDLAVNRWRALLALRPPLAGTNDIRLTLADRLYRSERWSEAAGEYTALVANPSPRKPALKMAANAVRSWEELLGIMPYEVAIARPPYGPTTDAATRAHAEAALLAAYDRYFALAPEPFDPEPAYVAASMAYRRAALLFRMGRSAEAAAAAERLATHPHAERAGHIAVAAAKLALDALEASGAQPDVCAAAARLAGVARLERPYPPDQPSLRARLREISRRCPPPSGT